MSTTKESVKKIQEGIADTSKQFQEGITETGRDVWYAGLGVLSTVEEEGSKLFNKFVDKGREMIKKGQEFEKRDKESGVAAKVDEAVKFVEKKFQSATEAIGLTPRDEVRALNEKVDKLTESVAALLQKLDNGATAGAKDKSKA